MRICRSVGLLVLLATLGSIASAEDRTIKDVKISEQTFRGVSSLLSNDPLSKSARDWSRLILLYALQTKDAMVVLDKTELAWVGLGEADPQQSLLLVAAYAAGNIRSQLNSGVKRNDRYSGLLTLFRVYRALREKNDKFKIAEVDELLDLHRDDKLVQHLQKLEDKKATKWSPPVEAAIRRLMNKR
jgi:hypothetical protein